MTRAKDRLLVYRSQRAAQVLESLDAGELYFLNNLPPRLYDFESLDGQTGNWQAYTGSGISLGDAEEFDFS